MWYFFQYEVKYYFKNIEQAIYIYGLFISVTLLAPFGLHGGLSQLQTLAPIILWIALATSVSLGGNQLFRRESEQGLWEYYQLLPIALEKLLLAKWVAFYAMVALPLVAVVPLLGLLMNIPSAMWLHNAIGLAVGAAALTAITSLAAALMAGLQRAGAIISLVILPLSIPVMIFGTYYCQTSGHDSQPPLLFNLGFAGLLLPIYCIAGASCLRAAN